MCSVGRLGVSRGRGCAGGGKGSGVWGGRCKGAIGFGGLQMGHGVWGCEGAKFWVQGACTEATAPSRMHGVHSFGGAVQRGHSLGCQGATRMLPCTYLGASSGLCIPALLQGSLKSRLKESGSTLATPGTEAAGSQLPQCGQWGQTTWCVCPEGGTVCLTFGGPAGWVIPQAPAALLEVGAGLPAVPGRDGDLAAAAPAADPTWGAAAAPGPPGSHHAAHRCGAGWRSRGEGKEGKKELK